MKSPSYTYIAICTLRLDVSRRSYLLQHTTKFLVLIRALIPASFLKLKAYNRYNKYVRLLIHHAATTLAQSCPSCRTSERIKHERLALGINLATPARAIMQRSGD